ncbi:MAG: acriflavin resistance protein [Kordiimonadales bacterium]|nr:MAG: acriflavin resistance protein [Kordiimonadales bacterium]
MLAAVKAFVERERQRLPAAISLDLTGDRASIVQERLDLLSGNGMQGIVMVSIALFMFFSVRYSFWVAAGLPISFLASFAVMSVMGMSINMISMVALLVAIGILMDDAIVIAENIAAEHYKGKSPLDAVVSGTKKVAGGVLASYATTVLIFTSLLSLKGDLGQILKVLPMVLIAVLTVSLFEAFFILPRHLLHSLEHAADKEKYEIQKRFDIWFEKQRLKMWKVVIKVVEYRYAFVGGILALFMVSISLLAGGVVKFRSFPNLDGDYVQARILMTPGSTLAQLEGVVAKTLEGLQETNEELSKLEEGELVRNVRVTYGYHIDAFESGPHLATISVDLLSADGRANTIIDITNAWRPKVGQLPGVLSIQYRRPQVGPGGRAIHIRLQGDDMDQLALASNDLKDWLYGYDGVVDILDDLRPGKPIMEMRLREGALALGLDAQTIASQVRANYQGIVAREIQNGDEAYEILVSLDKKSRSSLADFDRLTILHPQTGKPIPLSSVATLKQVRAYSRVHRVNSIRTVSVFADVDVDRINAGEVLNDVKANLLPQLAERYPGVTLALEGEAKNSDVTLASLQRSFMLGLLGVFMILCLQFKSYLEPVIVMVAIPLAFIGVIWGHLIMGLNLTMPSMVGAVSLAGIVVNDSILLVEFTKNKVREGMQLKDATAAASRDRFRAIFLTSFTTVAGVSPLLFETSMQAQILIPIVVSIAFGISMSTILVLFFLPALYSIFDDFGWTAKLDEDDDEDGLGNAPAKVQPAE